MKTHQQTHSRAHPVLVLGLVLALLAIGSLASWWIVVRADREIRANLMGQALLVARSLDTAKLKELGFDASNTPSEAYAQLCQKLTELGQTIRANWSPASGWLTIYTMKLRGDVICFGPESIPAGDPRSSPLGEIYSLPPPALKGVFATLRPAIVGPYTDEAGSFVSAFVPLLDSRAGQLAAVIGMDLSAGDWRWAVRERAAIPLGLMWVLLLGLGTAIAVTHPMGSAPKLVLRRVMPSLATLLLLMLSVVAALMYQQHQSQSERHTASDLYEAERDLQNALRQKIMGLRPAAQIIASDPRVHQALSERAAASLLATWRPLFKAWQSENQLSQLNFIDTNRICLLRIHEPDKFGDRIERHTLLEAERTGKPFSGLELGPLGSFSQRFVEPVFAGTTRVGYVELGVNIDEVLKTLYALPNEAVAVLILKDHLNQQRWEQGLRLLGRDAVWNRLPRCVVTYASQGNLPEPFAVWADGVTGRLGHGEFSRRISLNGKDWNLAAVPLHEASGKEVGALLIMRDLSPEKAALTRLLVVGGSAAAVLVAFLFGLIYVLLRRADDNIRAQQAKLERSEAHYRILSECGTDVIWMLDVATNRLTYVSPSVQKLRGYSVAETLGQTLQETMTAEAYKTIMNSMPGRIAAFAAGDDSVRTRTMEIDHPRRDGTTVPTEVVTTLITGADGQVTHVQGVSRDVTARKAAEQALAALNRRLEGLVRERTAEALDLYNSAPCGYYSLGTDERILQMNDTHLRWLGYQREEVEGRLRLTELMSAENAERFSKTHSEFVEKGDAVAGEWEFLCRDGSVLTTLASAAAVRDSNGHLVKVHYTALNITKRKQAEKALQMERQRLAGIISGTNVATWEWNIQTGAVVLNERWAAIKGYTLADLSPINIETVLEFVHPDDIPASRAVLERHLRGELDSFDFEARMRHRDGSWVWVWEHGRVISWTPDGKPLMMQGTQMDITRLKLADHSLRKLSRAVEFSPSMILITDQLGQVEYANPAWEKVTGYSLQEVIGQRPRMLKSGVHTREFYSHLWGEITAGRIWRGQFCNRRKNGELFWESAAIAPVKDDTGIITHFVAVKEDITAQKQAAEELRLAKEAAEAANRAKSTFLANMSHEIRTPMNAILGFAQLMLQDSALADHHRQQLNTITRSGEHLLNVINDILEMSRIESGRVTLSLAAFDLYGLLDDLERMFSLRAQAKQLCFRVERLSLVPQYVITDATKLRQVIINLLANGVKFTPAGGEVVLRVASETEPDGMLRLRMEIQDTGPGIAAEDLQQLFQAFYQARGGRETGGGTGLGLAISREFVRMMGGDLTATSQVEVGSTFRFDILVAQTGESNVGTKNLSAWQVQHLRPGLPACRVLAVDDEKVNLELLWRLLIPVGFEVRTASNGPEAVALCRKWSPHVLLMDLRMPVMDGYEAMRRIRAAHGAAVKIIALSGCVFVEDQQQALAAGADAFLSKPFRLEDLLEQIKRLAGVDYVSNDPNAAGAELDVNAKTEPPSAEEVLRLPTQLVDSLYEAVCVADYDRMLALTAQLASQDEDLGRRLRQLVERFEYETLQTALSVGKRSN